MVIKFKELGTHQIPGHQAAAEQGGKEEKEGYNPKLKKKTLYFRNKVYVDKNISLFK